MLKRAVAALLAIAVLVVAVTWGYIDLLRDDAPERLTLEANPGSQDAPRPARPTRLASTHVERTRR